MGRAALFLIVLLAVTTAGFTVLGLHVVHDSVNRTLEERRALAEIAASRVDDLLSDTIDHLQALAEQYNLSPTDPTCAGAALALKAMRWFHTDTIISHIAVLDSSGRVVCTEPNLQVIAAADMSTRHSVEQALAGGPPGVSRVLTLGQDQEAAAIVIGIQGSNGDRGVVFAVLNLSAPSLSRILEPLRLGQTGYAEVVDRDGIVLASTEPSDLWQSADHGNYLGQLVANGSTAVGTCHSCHDSGGAEKANAVLAFAPLTTAPWGVAVLQSSDEAMTYVNSMEQRMLLFGFGIFLAALTVGLLATGRLIQPIQALDRACQRIRTGEPDVDIPTGGVGEIHSMAQSIRQMHTRLRQLADESKKSADELELRVRERTRDLEASRNNLEKAHTELSELHHILAQKERRLSHLLDGVIHAQEEERKRVARELHDETSQALTVLIVSLDTTVAGLSGEDAGLKAHLSDLRTLAAGVHKEVQRIILDLRPGLLDDLGLVAAIDWYADSRLKPLDIRVNLEVAGEEARLGAEVETAVFRLAQEALNNIVRYSEAENVLISLDFGADRVVLRVEDDGKGFDVDEVMRDQEGSRSFGLLGMRERVALFGGTLDIQSRPGQGTQITAIIPLDGTD